MENHAHMVACEKMLTNTLVSEEIDGVKYTCNKKHNFQHS